MNHQPQNNLEIHEFNTNDNDQIKVETAMVAAIKSISLFARKPITATEAWTICANFLSQKLNQSITDANMLAFLVKHGLLLSVCGSAELLPIQSVEYDQTLLDYYPRGTPKPKLCDLNNKVILFSRVMLGEPVATAKWGDGSSPLGAYTQGCVFLMSHGIRTRILRDWEWTRSMVMASTIFQQKLTEAADSVAKDFRGKSFSIGTFVRCKHILRSYLNGKDLSKLDINSVNPPADFKRWCHDDIEANVAYHEIAGHFVHDKQRGQVSQWHAKEIPYAEARARLCECKHGPLPFLGVVYPFNQLDSSDNRNLAGTEVQLFFSSLLGDSNLPSATSKECWKKIANDLASKSDDKLREMANEALTNLEQMQKKKRG